MITKLIYITVTMPFGNAEQFFIPEVIELMRQGQEIMIVPRSPSGNIINSDAKGLQNLSLSQPLLSLEILWVALCEFARCPFKSLQAIGMLFRSRSLKLLSKNLTIFPKALWLSRRAQDWGGTHIHAQWATTTSTMALVANQISGIPWSFTAHRGDIRENNLLKVKVQKASFVRFISESGVQMAREILREQQLQGKIRLIHMGVSLPPLIKNQVTQSTPLVILCPARLHPVKGHTYLLRALSILKGLSVNCIVKIVGEGELREELEREVKELNLIDIVQFLGHLPHNELLEFYRDGKVAIVALPSVDLGNGNHEGVPVSLIEAMSYGIPVVSTTVGGTPELLQGNVGVLVPPEDPISLAEALERLIKDGTLRIQLAEVGRKRVMEEYCVRHTVTKLRELFNEF